MLSKLNNKITDNQIIKPDLKNKNIDDFELISRHICVDIRIVG